MLMVEEPVIVFFLIMEKDVQVVIAQNALCPTCLDNLLHFVNHCRTFWATVGQISK
jgi:hypothetical protein